MSKRSRQKQSRSQRILWFLSLLLVGSMVISLVLVALPGPPAPTPTAIPTLTPIPHPTSTATPPPPAPSPTMAPTLAPTVEPTQPAMGPELPTATPEITPTLTVTPTQSSQATQTPAAAARPSETPAASLKLAAANPDVSFAVCGDSRGHPEIYRRVLDAVAADGSEFLIHTGDLVNKGSESLWQEVQQVMADFPLPFYPVPGNHDSLGGKLDNYLAYSGAQVAHYSLDRGPVHLALADSHNGGIGASELAWLREDLSATDQPIKMVVLHHPPFDPDGSDHIMAYGNEQFMDLMAEMQVDYVFAGHIHAYAQGERDGVQYFYTGGAGAPPYKDGHPQAFYHYLRVTVTGDEVRVEVVKI